MSKQIGILWLMMACWVFAGGKKEDTLLISFHLQGSATDGPKISVPQNVAGQQMHFRIAPEVSTRDIGNFSPFPAEDGSTYGVVFQLKGIAVKRFAGISNANRGKLLMCRFNGRPLDVVEIDKQINDGILVAWQGVTNREIAALDAMMPRIGETAAEWKEKKKNR